MGEPVVVCSAQISNPAGSITFQHDGQLHTVQITEENGKLLTPYNVDYAIAYKSIHSDNTYYIGRCNTGIPGSWANDALNVPFSPDWDDFLCWTGGDRPRRPDPMPDSLGENWCRTIGNAESRTLDEANAKERFAGNAEGEPTMRAVSVHVASFAVNYNDIVFAETKKLSAEKIAQRKFDQTEQLRGSLPSQASGAVAQAADKIDAAISDAKSLSDPREQARTLQEALRDVFSIEEQAPTTQFLQLKNAIVKLLSADDERSFIAQTKQTLAEAQTAHDATAKSVAAFLDAQRSAAANAPAFAFADGSAPTAATGPANITHEIRQIKAHEGPVRSVAFHPDGKRIISSGQRGLVTMWNVETGERIARFEEVSGKINVVAFSPDGKYVFGGSDAEGYMVHKWDVDTRDVLFSFVGMQKDFTSISVSPDSQFLLSGEDEGKVTLWSLEPNRFIENIVEANKHSYSTFSADGRYAIYRRDREIIWYDLQTKTTAGSSSKDTGFYKLVPATKIGVMPFGPTSSVPTDGATVYTVDGPHLYAVHPNGYRDGGYSLSARDAVVVDFAISPDGKYFVSGDVEGNVTLTEVEKGILHHLLGRHDEQQPELIGRHCLRNKCDLARVNSVAFSPDGSLAVSAGADGTIRIWGPAPQ